MGRDSPCPCVAVCFGPLVSGGLFFMAESPLFRLGKIFTFLHDSMTGTFSFLEKHGKTARFSEGEPESEKEFCHIRRCEIVCSARNPAR